MKKKQVVLITGASSGIGKETAKLLLQDDYIVYAAARRVEKMEDLKALGAIPIKMDVTDEANMVGGIQQIESAHSGVDILINNAGYGNFASLEETPIHMARAQYDVNVFGMMRLTQLVLPGMRARKSGKIVNISSIGGKIVEPFGGWYHSTKFAVEALSDILRMEVKPFGIDVIIIEPGLIASDWDNIATQSLMEISGSGAYAEAAKKSAKMIQANYKNASPPSGVAKTIYQSIKARRPKTRYLTGHMSRLLVFAKWLLPDRVFDWVIMNVGGEFPPF